MAKEMIGTDVPETEESVSRKKQKRLWKYSRSILSNVIFFFIINLFPLWITKTKGVVTSDWINVLWAMDLAIVTVVLGSIILIAYSPKWLRSLIEFLMSITALISVVVFLNVFPLNFSLVSLSWLNSVIKALLIVGIVGASIGIIASLAKFIKAAAAFDLKK